MNIKLPINDAENEKTNCNQSAIEGKNKCATKTPKVAAWVVPITPGETNLFFATDCIIKPATLSADALRIIVKVLGILEIKRISIVSGVNRNNVNKFTSRLASILNEKTISTTNKTILIILLLLIIIRLQPHKSHDSFQ